MSNYNDIVTELKCGEYDGTTIMRAWVAIKELEQKLEDAEFKIATAGYDAVMDMADNYVNGPIDAELSVDYLYEYANKLKESKQ